MIDNGLWWKLMLIIIIANDGNEDDNDDDFWWLRIGNMMIMIITIMNIKMATIIQTIILAMIILTGMSTKTMKDHFRNSIHGDDNNTNPYVNKNNIKVIFIMVMITILTVGITNKDGHGINLLC